MEAAESYKCPYCGNMFKCTIQKYVPKMGSHSSVTGQVRCPRCGNFLVSR